jgi:dienelactone hydrolase
MPGKLPPQLLGHKALKQGTCRPRGLVYTQANGDPWDGPRVHRRHPENEVMMRIRSVALTVLMLTAVAGPGRSLAQGNTKARDVVYGRKFGMALTMDVWKPPQQNGIGVLFMVSGAFKSDIDMVDSGMFGPALFKPFLDRGHTLFLVCHGAQPKFTVSEIVPDIHRAVRFIRVHAKDHGVDPDRLGIMGASSGGFLSLTIGATGKPGDGAAKDPIDRASSRVQAVACVCPPCDLVDYGKVGRSIVEYEPVQFAWHAFGVQHLPRDEQIRVLRGLSPINAVSKDMPPTLIIHGDADPKVPHEQSVRFAARLEANKVPHQLIIRKNAGHGWPEMAKDYALLADWFGKHLRPAVEKDR